MSRSYRKDGLIQAEQFDGSDEMINKYDLISLGDEQEEIGIPYNEEFLILTSMGTLSMYIDDWIATGVNGEHWPIADEVFKKTYAELPVIPKAVADWIEECKQKQISIGDMLCSERRPEKMRDWMAMTPETYQFCYERYRKYQELVARAWLYGYQVKEVE